MKKNILFTFGVAYLLSLCLKVHGSNADTVLPRLSIKERIEIFKAIINKNCRFSNRVKDGKVYMRVKWYTDSIVNEGDKMMEVYARNVTFLICDFILSDSLKAFAEVQHLFFFDKRDNYYDVTIELNNFFPELSDPKYEMYTIPEKIDLFFGASSYKATYTMDTVAKTILFYGTGRYRSYIDDYARLGFAYILRNRLEQFNTLIFHYEGEGGEIVSRIYKLRGKDGIMDIEAYRGLPSIDNL